MKIGWIFLGSGLLTFLLMPGVRWLAVRLNLLDHPGPRKIHQEPMPLLGGLAMVLGSGTVVLLALQGAVPRPLLSVGITATLLFALGMLDDKGWLHPQVKLGVGMSLAALVVLAAGGRIPLFSGSIPGGTLLELGVTWLWVVGMTAAFSILDHMDGVCAGIAALTGLGLAGFALQTGRIEIAIIVLAISGAALGFLVFNFHPARIFMGDAGAMFLGFALASLATFLPWDAYGTGKGLILIALTFAVPILDTSLVILSRLRRGLVPFSSPGKDHMAHRLMNLGLTVRQTAGFLYGVQILCIGLAFLLRGWRGWFVGAVGLLLTGLWLGLLVALEHAPFEDQRKIQEFQDVP